MGEGEPRLLVWNNPEGSTPPPTAALQAVYQKWKLFAERMATQVAAVFGSQAWPALWSAIVTRYQHVSFRELVRSAAITSWDPDNPGDFGGLGMSADESSIFYAIGIGDGSWGAFYDVCSCTRYAPRSSASAVTCNWCMAASMAKATRYQLLSKASKP